MGDDFLIRVLASVVGGILLATIFFILNECIFKVPKLSGCWSFKVITKKTAYNPYNDMILTYKALIWIEGKNIYGSAEKLLEQCGKSTKEYIGKNRTQCSLSGYYQKNYFSKDEIVIHIDEKGEQRNSSTIHNLKRNGKSLEGVFTSTIADSEGRVIWERPQIT